MELHEKLQELRRKRGLTQEELARALYVSRTAVSKWESGRGYPNIDSLRAIATFFSITVDELLSSDEVLCLAEEDQKQKQTHFIDLSLGLLDLAAAMLLFLPFFGQRINGSIQAVPLLSLTQISPYLKTAYFAIVIAILTTGILTLALQNCRAAAWTKSKSVLSLLLEAVGALLFVVSLQPYAAVLLFVFLAIKSFVLIKRK